MLLSLRRNRSHLRLRRRSIVPHLDSRCVLLGCRVLEVVLAAPYLPGPRQLRELFPCARVREGVIALPLGLGSAEEALALCAAERLPVAASRIAYGEISVDALPAGSLG